jgi:DNA-binding protein Fis
LPSIFKIKDYVNETIDHIVALLSNRETMRKELLDESVRVLARYFNELTGQEGVLLRDYENALKVLKEK